MVTVIVILIVLALIAAIAFLVSDKVKDLFHLGGKHQHFLRNTPGIEPDSENGSNEGRKRQ